MRKGYSLMAFSILPALSMAMEEGGKNISDKLSATALTIIGTLLIIMVGYVLMNPPKRKFNA